jgi:hypothetical protein
MAVPTDGRSDPRTAADTALSWKGLQIHQEIPDDVWRAYEELVEAGYDKYLIK